MKRLSWDVRTLPREIASVADMNIEMLLRALVCFVSLAAPAAASGVIRITGQIPCAGRLEIRELGPAFEVESAGPLIRLRLRGNRVGASPIVLSLRTNCRYRIAAEWLGPDSSRLRISPAQLEPAAGWNHLSPTALEAVVTPVDMPPNAPVTCVEGRRISRGGNDLTPDNAVLVRLSPLIPDSAQGAVLVLRLHLDD